jgi:Protein kinase domain/Calx-beta domain
MSAELDRFRASLVDQLSNFDHRLNDKIDDVQMLAEMQQGIGRLLGSKGGNEAEIRRVLQDRYDKGELRKETFQLVKSMLDRYVTEQVETSPDIRADADALEAEERANGIQSGASAAAAAPHGMPPADKTVVIAPPAAPPAEKTVVIAPPAAPPADKTVVIAPPFNPPADKTVVIARPFDPPALDAMAALQPATNAAADDDDESTDGPMVSTVVLPMDETFKPDDADGRVQVGSVLRDRYMLQERVSGGSMGVVYKALDRRLAEAATGEPWVAVKILAPQLSQNGKALRALQQEAAKGRCLTHPNIVRFIDLDRDDDLYFLVMEWLEGRTLADILDSPDSRSIDKQRAFDIVRQIGKALDYAHRCGIVHADVKPGNIMIAPNGEAKLFDFGVARVRQQQIGNDEFDPGVLGLLTPAYSSMQVLTGEKPVPSDDVFSLACLLYRLIAGYRVFGPRNAAEAAEDAMKPQRLEALTDAQWRVMKKALSYSRVTRYESMGEFIDALGTETSDSTESFTVDVPAPARFGEANESGNKGMLVIACIVVLALAAVAANQLGYLDDFKAKYLSRGAQAPVIDAPAELVPQQEAPPPIAEEPAVEEEPIEELAVESEPVANIVEDPEPIAIPEPEKFVAPLVDYSKLPPPTAELFLPGDYGNPEAVTVTLRENGRPATVDLVREHTEFPLTLRVEEIGFSGNRSPWVSGQYSFSDNGFIEFPVGQNRARVTLSMLPDPVREPDQQSTLRVREADAPGTELATINVVLEDDDQRAFEATLPANTVAFATSQVSVNEDDPAVQIDIIRFNPDNTPLVVGYVLRDITATQGQDYFAPGRYTIEFGPGQRTTRLLIPLVQDTAYEDNEAFSVELSIADSAADTDVFRRVAVMIRDDDQ